MTKNLLKATASLLISFFLFFALHNSVMAADCNWTGNTNNDWHTASNWTNCGGFIPQTTDVALIGSGPDVHLSQATTVAELAMDDNTLVFNYDAIAGSPLQVTGDITLFEGTEITHAAATSASGGTIVGTISILQGSGGTFTTEEGAVINADGKGYPSSTGSGQGCDTTDGAGGGGFGGNGGRGYGCTTGGDTYGEFRNQTTYLGSGGGEQQWLFGGTSGAGGGAIELITATFVHNGDISANGANGTGSNGAGGGGGYIKIYSNVMSGEGFIVASGGNGGSYGGGGGGGRIYTEIGTSSSYSYSNFAPAGTSGGSVPGTKPAGEGTVVTLYTANNDVVFHSSIMLKPSDEPLYYGDVSIYKNVYFQSDIVSGTRVGVYMEATNLELMSSAANIIATGRGYPEGEGPGQGADFDGAYGGGYGGRGGSGYGATDAGGGMYDTFQEILTDSEKINVGSAGGVNTSGPGWGVSGAGGGGIWLYIIDTLTMPSGSSIKADGANGVGNNGAGGSGGAIFLNVDTIEGSGSISANGGNGGNYGGGGGGGRTIIKYDDKSAYSGTVTAVKGVNGVNIGGKAPTSGSAVMINNDTNDLDILSSMTISDNDSLISYTDITIASNQTIYLEGTDLAGTGVGVTMYASGTFTLPSSSTISADGLGHPMALGLRPGCDGDGPGGGAHGGNGTRGYGCIYTSVAHGDENAPVALGSGGGNNTSGPGWGISSAGGGAIKIVAEDALINGTISANAGTPSGNNGAGGAGGSIWLDISGEIDGSGIIRANGANGQQYGGGGGGGRILIEYGTDNFSGSVIANGGVGGGSSSGGNAGNGSIVY